MAISRQQKEQILTKLGDLVTDMKSAVFLSYEGLSVHELEELRAKLRESGSKMMASKRTLIERVLKDRGIDAGVDAYEGGLAIAFGLEDEVGAAKTSHEFAKDHESLVVHGGLLVQGDTVQAMNPDEVSSLAKLPSKDQLLAQTVGAVRAPLSGFINVLAGNQRGLVNVLNAIKEAKA